MRQLLGAFVGVPVRHDLTCARLMSPLSNAFCVAGNRSNRFARCAARRARIRVHVAALLDRRRRAQEPVGLPLTRPGVLTDHEQPLRLERIQLATAPNQTIQPRLETPNPHSHTPTLQKG